MSHKERPGSGQVLHRGAMEGTLAPLGEREGDKGDKCYKGGPEGNSARLRGQRVNIEGTWATKGSQEGGIGHIGRQGGGQVLHG